MELYIRGPPPQDFYFKKVKGERIFYAALTDKIVPTANIPLTIIKDIAARPHFIKNTSIVKNINSVLVKTKLSLLELDLIEYFINTPDDSTSAACAIGSVLHA